MGHHQKTKDQIMGIDVGEESQPKGRDQIFNRIPGENLPRLRKDEAMRYQKHTEHQLDKARKGNSMAYHR